jgi:hypothetical protein
MGHDFDYQNPIPKSMDHEIVYHDLIREVIGTVGLE